MLDLIQVGELKFDPSRVSQFSSSSIEVKLLVLWYLLSVKRPALRWTISIFCSYFF